MTPWRLGPQDLPGVFVCLCMCVHLCVFLYVCVFDGLVEYALLGYMEDVPPAVVLTFDLFCSLFLLQVFSPVGPRGRAHQRR